MFSKLQVAFIAFSQLQCNVSIFVNNKTEAVRLKHCWRASLWLTPSLMVLQVSFFFFLVFAFLRRILQAPAHRRSFNHPLKYVTASVFRCLFSRSLRLHASAAGVTTPAHSDTWNLQTDGQIRWVTVTVMSSWWQNTVGTHLYLMTRGSITGNF